MSAGIYCVTVSRPGKPLLFYIGQAVDLARRQFDHARHLQARRHCNRRLQSLHDKYGSDAFRCEVLLVCSPEELTRYEQAVLDHYLATAGRRVLNIQRQCVVTPRGIRHTARSRANMSAAKKGKPGRLWTEESKAKLRLTKKGKMPSAATITAGIVARLGTRASAQTRAKMSASQRGRVDPPEVRKKKRLAALAREAAKRNLSWQNPHFVVRDLLEADVR
jgi:group I intron endonuclease